MSDVVDPPYASWASLLRRNIDKRAYLASVLGEARIATIRAEVMECARNYSQHLTRIATERGIAIADSAPLSNDDRNGIVMAGHQPVVFHPGLCFKTELLSTLTRDTGAFGVHVVIDTDEGSVCEVSWPRIDGEQLIVRRAAIATPELRVADRMSGEQILFSSQRIKAREEINGIFDEMQSDLLASGLADEAERARTMGDIYANLAGCPLAAANSIARWSVERRGYREVLLSMLLKETSLRGVLRELTQDAERLFRSYNESLERYRGEHSIKNAANPFPNLKAESGSYELPLWIVSDRGRRPLWSGASQPIQPPEDSYLATKGSITTMLLRAYCSDIFIHGLGGGKYDRFVTMFASEYLKVELPTFVVASRTRVLDEKRVERLSASIARGHSIKEVVAQTQRYLGTGIFNEVEETRLRDIVVYRLKLREEMSKAVTADQRSATTDALNQSNREVREIVQNSSLRADVEGLHRNESLLERWSFRGFPYFIFEGCSEKASVISNH
ncbi:MAG: hypothetical protein RL326_573 [Pseudomonadota bacterium]|jgi:hypothetical protein